jgi:CRP-like cAMP-binding protein
VTCVLFPFTRSRSNCRILAKIAGGRPSTRSDPESKFRLGHAFNAASLYDGLTARVERVLSSLKRPRPYEAGSEIFSVDDRPQGVFTLISGRAHLFKFNENHEEILVRQAEPGEVFGVTELLSDSPFEAGLRAVSTCKVEFVTENDYLKALSTEPELCFQLLRQLSLRCRALIGSLG